MLLGSCALEGQSPPNDQEGRAAFGLVLRAVPNDPGMFWRVGIFTPLLGQGRHRDSLRLFQRLGAIETLQLV